MLATLLADWRALTDSLSSFQPGTADLENEGNS
jgi:hypothetical protein